MEDKVKLLSISDLCVFGDEKFEALVGYSIYEKQDGYYLYYLRDFEEFFIDKEDLENHLQKIIDFYEVVNMYE